MSDFIATLALTFGVTNFDVIVALCIFGGSLGMYYFFPIHTLFEVAFGAVVGLGIYIILSVLLLGNGPLGTSGGLLPFGFSVFLVSTSIYLVFVLACIFPMHGGLLVSEPREPMLYTLQYFLVSSLLFFTFGAILIYMIEQAYLFRPGTIFVFIRENAYYQQVVKGSFFYNFVLANQNEILPLGILLLLYKILLSNLINAALLSIWYNIRNIGFYRANKNDAHYRVEFHEVGEDTHSNDDHTNDSGGEGSSGHTRMH